MLAKAQYIRASYEGENGEQMVVILQFEQFLGALS